jgi:hypothetical protein
MTKDVRAIGTNDLDSQKNCEPNGLLLSIIPYLVAIKSLPDRSANGAARATFFEEPATQLAPPRFAETFV